RAARLAAGARRLRGCAGTHHRVVPGTRRLVATQQAGRRGDVRREGPVDVPTLDTTPIPGLLVVTLDVHGDNRGWLKENWQRAKMTELGLADFGPVQQNVSFNGARGVTRGVHAEPWDKFVSVVTGRADGAGAGLPECPPIGRT